jgi:hypothetical protein
MVDARGVRNSEDIEIRYYMSRSKIKDEYIDNLVLLIDIYDYIGDELLKQAIEERVNAFAGNTKWINLHTMNKNNLYYEYVEKKDYNASYYRICRDKDKDKNKNKDKDGV